MIRSTGYPKSIRPITAGLVLFAAACTPLPALHFKLETTAYRSFPSTARVQKTCVIEAIGMNEFSQSHQFLEYSFDPQSLLREGLVYGLQRTCLRTTADPRAGNADALDLAREIGVLANVTAVSMRFGHSGGGLDDMDEVEVVASITLYRGGAPPLIKVVEGRGALLPGYGDIESAITFAIVDTVDGVNQLIFDNRASLQTSPEHSREKLEKTPRQ